MRYIKYIAFALMAVVMLPLLADDVVDDVYHWSDRQPVRPAVDVRVVTDEQEPNQSSQSTTPNTRVVLDQDTVVKIVVNR